MVNRSNLFSGHVSERMLNLSLIIKPLPRNILPESMILLNNILVNLYWIDTITKGCVYAIEGKLEQRQWPKFECKG